MTTTWREVTLGDLESESGGTIQTGPFGSQLHASDHSNVGTPVVMPTNIRDLRISTDGIARVRPDHVERLSRHKLRTGDIVYSRRGDVEKCALVAAEQDGWLCGTGCLLVRLDGPTVDARFLAYALSLPETRGWISQHAVGATMANLNTGVLREVPVSLPPVGVQRSIAGTLGALDDKIESNRLVVKHAHDLLDAIADMYGVALPPVPLSSLTELTRSTVDPSTMADSVVDHFSLPAFDTAARPEHVAASTIMSNKIGLTANSILVSRLNPRTNRTWWAVPADGVLALASTEFAVLTAADDLDLAALWLAVRDPYFRDELGRRVTGTSGSHQRVRPGDFLAIEVPDARKLPAEVRATALALLQHAYQRRGESARLIELRDTLLPKLLSGRIRVLEAVVDATTEEIPEMENA